MKQLHKYAYQPAFILKWMWHGVNGKQLVVVIEMPRQGAAPSQVQE